MLRFSIHICVLFASLALCDTLNRREALGKRECNPGATLCGQIGTLQYCANPGYKCCSSRYISPLSGTCCPGGNSYAPAGYYCCTDGYNCQNGRTCRGCTPANGNNGISGGSTFGVPTTSPPSAVTTRLIPTYTYYTYTITYYYYLFYLIYVPSITQSTQTSSRVTTTTRVSVYASNSADAAQQFQALSATISLPTPASATVVPALPSSTSAFDLASSTTTSGSSARGAAAATSSTVSFGGGGASKAQSVIIGRLWYRVTCTFALAIVVGGMVMLFATF